MSFRLLELSRKRELKIEDVRNPLETGPGRTKQEFVAECDINNILRRFTRDRFLTHVNQREPMFLDVSEVGDFRTAIDQVRAATEYFEQLPAKVRARFGNDPARFMDEAGQLGRGELRELGLAELRAGDRPERRRPVAPPEEAPGTVTP